MSQNPTDALIEALIQQAASPQSASNDNGSMTARPLTEIIEAIKFVANRKAMSKPGFGVSIQTAKPPGAVFSADELASIDPAEWAWNNRRF
jgi:hypothetical protein